MKSENDQENTDEYLLAQCFITSMVWFIGFTND